MSSTEKLGQHRFHLIDYIAFGVMLLVSASCGIYYGYIKPKHQPRPSKTRKFNFGSKLLTEYLLGSRQLKIFPVAMSLVASYISGVTILGTPSEIYIYGTQYWLIIIPIILMGITVAYVYLPIFSSLKIGSSYEYLELRFSKSVRTMASVMFVFDEFFFLPIIIYVPALAFNQVTGANLHLIGTIVCVICVFYTFLGGMRAVVSTDAWQIVIMFIAVVVIAIIGTVHLGGIVEVFDKANKGGRIIFTNFNPSFYERQSFWGVMIGGFLFWTSFNSVNQTMVQRYMSVPSIEHAKTAMIIFTVGVVLSVSLCCYTGLLIFAQYYDCDPLTSGLINTDDQLYPLFVMETVGDLYGIPGLFIAGVFGAALSSLSVVLNSTSAIIFEDILKNGFNIKFTEKGGAICVKACILVLGVISVLFLFIVEKLGGVLSVATALTAIASGTTFGVFSLGMLNPWSNTKGALSGAITAAILSGTVALGSQIESYKNSISLDKLPVSTNACANFTIDPLDDLNDDGSQYVFPLFRLSFHWVNPIGVFTVLIIGSVVSYLTGARNLKEIDPELITPIFHRFLPNESMVNYGTVKATSKSYLAKNSSHQPLKDNTGSQIT